MREYTGVYELDSSDDITINDALGISEQRLDELKELLPKLVEKNDRVSETLEAMWNAVDHPNEFAWMVYIYGCNTGLQRSKSVDLLKDLIDKFKKDED